MLVVRIIDLWFVQTKDKYEQAEMIIMDENVVLFKFLMLLIDIIHVLIRKEELKTWKSTLKENNTYMTHNFKIINNKGQYKICLHPYKLIFNDVTIVIEKDLPNIPLKAYDFINFVYICGGTYGHDLLDGNAIYCQTSFSILCFCLQLVLCSEGVFELFGQAVTCTLWDDLCLQWVNYLREAGGMKTMVIMLIHTRIKEAKGVYPITITNTWQGSKLLINESLLEIQQFKERPITLCALSSLYVVIMEICLSCLIMFSYLL
ncbi:hypothetical protein HKD37_02G005110 [Glycine soja]